MQSTNSAVRVDPVACKGCGVCVKACEYEAISLVNGIARVDQSRCTGCDACLAICPHGAMIKSVVGEIVEASAVPQTAAPPTTPAVQVTPRKAVGIAGLATAAGLVARKALPWLLDVVLSRLDRPTENGVSGGTAAPSGVSDARGGGSGRRRRHRGRHSA